MAEDFIRKAREFIKKLRGQGVEEMALDDLIKKLKDPNPRVRWNAATNIAEIVETQYEQQSGVEGDNKAARVMRRMYGRQTLLDFRRLDEIAEKCPGYHWETAFPLLMESLQDEMHEVRHETAMAMKNIVLMHPEHDWSSFVPNLIACLKDYNELCEQSEIAKLLGEIGDTRAVQPLVEIYEINGSLDYSNVPTALQKIIEKNPDKDWSFLTPLFTRALKNEYAKESVVALIYIEKKNPGSVKLEDVQRSLKEFVEESKDKESARKKAAEIYTRIAGAVSQGREKIDMPGELLPDKPKPPRRTFRRRVLRGS